jgi:hypothetical protein
MSRFWHYNGCLNSAEWAGTMSESEEQDKAKSGTVSPTKNEWGSQPEDNFGYASEEERRARRGLEDWEMLEQMSGSQPGLFDWLRTVVGAVIAGVVVFLLCAYGIYYIAYHYGPALLGKG